MTENPAHGISLHLFMVLVKAKESSLLEASAIVGSCLDSLQLADDLSALVTENSSGIDINLTPKSEWGSRILDELYKRIHPPECEEGLCKFDEHGYCKWCGRTATE